jgi:RND family efflux transporter MFP subunit
MNFLSVKAPFTGKITKRLVDHGALVQSGLTEDNPQGIVELQEISPIRLTVPLPESDIAAIEKGMDVTVTFPELPGESFKAKVSRTAEALDPASKTMQVEIDIDNPDGFIKPGMYAKVIMRIGSRESVLSLPVTAQWIFQDQPFILVVKNNMVERVHLRKGLSNKDYFEGLNPEITESTLVIVQGKGLVQPGQIVKPVLKIK